MMNIECAQLAISCLSNFFEIFLYIILSFIIKFFILAVQFFDSTSLMLPFPYIHYSTFSTAPWEQIANDNTCWSTSQRILPRSTSLSLSVLPVMTYFIHTYIARAEDLTESYSAKQSQSTRMRSPLQYETIITPAKDVLFLAAVDFEFGPHLGVDWEFEYALACLLLV